jgi:glutathione S-transferase
MSASITIYGMPQSRAARCLWMARELGVDHVNDPVHFTKTKESPALLSANPNQRIPALVDGAFSLFESLAINMYLAKKYGGGTGFESPTLEHEALVTQWSFWAMTELEKPLLGLLMAAFGRDDGKGEEHKAALERPLKVLNDHLNGRAWMVGTQFGTADVNVASVLSWAIPAKFDLGKWPRVAEWLGRCTARPAFKG